MESTVNIGQTVYLRRDLGDYFEGQHVVVLAGTPATVAEFDDEFVVVDVPDSPGQKRLRTRYTEFWNFWGTICPTLWEHLLGSDLV